MSLDPIPLHTLDGEHALLRVHMACLAEQAQRHPGLAAAYTLLQTGYEVLLTLLEHEALVDD